MNTQPFPALATLANYTKPELLLAHRAIAAVMQEPVEPLHRLR